MKYNRYEFAPGDLVVTSQFHKHPDHRGILMERIKRHGTWTWRIYWFNGAPCPRPQQDAKRDTECEVNLFNLRRRYHFYNNEGEYYVSENR